MKSKISKIIFFTLLPIICFAVIGFFGISSFVNGYALAYSGNGGVFYVGKNSVYNHTTGTISGASATNGGAIYVENGGTLNINGGTISNNTATGNGGGIYVANGGTLNITNGEIAGNSAVAGGGIYIESGGTVTMSGGKIFGNSTSATGAGRTTGTNVRNFGTFTMTGGVIGESGTQTSWGIDNNSATLNLLGGTVYSDLWVDYLNISVNLKLYGKILFTLNTIVNVTDYEGITPNYTIELPSDRQTGTIITFKGSSTRPDISKLTVAGYDTEKYELKTEKDSEGNWVVVLKMIPQYTRVEENGYSYVYFGSYPQTIKASNVTVDESKYKTNQAGGKYYLGSDGEYYAKFTANPYQSSYVFSDGTTIVSGTSYYFKVEPIKWRILSEDNGQAIILAELILDAHQFYSSESDRTIDGKTIYANNYKYSDIRSWLNGYSSTYGEDWNNKGFLQRAFSESEQEYIQTTLVDNSAFTDANGSTANYACENTNDKVWLLSYQDMINTGYGFNSDRTNYDTMRRKKTSDYSRANCVWYSTSSDYLYNGYWGSRSPSSSADHDAWYSYSNSYVDFIYVNLANRGVVPALTISLDGSASDTPVSWSFASGASENNASADTLHKSDTLATNSKANSIFNFNTFATIKEYNNTLFGFNAFTNANYYLNTLHNFNGFTNSKDYIKSLCNRYGFANNKNRNTIYDFENKDGKTCFLTQTGKSLPSSCRYCMSEGGLKNFNTPQYIVNTLTNIDLLSDKRKSYALLFGNKKYKSFYEPKVYEIA